MKRLGKFTGRIYDDNIDAKNILECALCLSDAQAEDISYINRRRLENKIACRGCYGCPASNEVN